MKIFIATKNHHKLEELERIFRSLWALGCSAKNDLESPLPRLRKRARPHEENALLKAYSGLKVTKLQPLRMIRD